MIKIDLNQVVTLEQKTEEARAAKFMALADLRWRRETGGLTLPDGARIITTREAQAQIASTVQSIQAGLLKGPLDWKLASGWVQMEAEDVQQIARAIATHVKRCFTAERLVCERMTALPGDLAEFDTEHAYDIALRALA